MQARWMRMSCSRAHHGAALIDTKGGGHMGPTPLPPQLRYAAGSVCIASAPAVVQHPCAPIGPLNQTAGSRTDHTPMRVPAAHDGLGILLIGTCTVGKT